MAPSIVGFVACTAVIVWAGTRITRYADVIAQTTGLGRVWTGMLLLAIATSLPELFNSTSAVIQDVPDIAAGDIAGSNVLNLAILGFVDVFSRRRTLCTDLDRVHVRTVLFVMLISTLAATSVLIGPRLPVLGWISPVTPVILILYFAAFRRTDSPAEIVTALPASPSVPLRTAILRYSLFGLIVILAAITLPGFGSRLAEQSGLGNTFVGSLLIAFTTSLPELVTASAAVRMGAAELAVGGLLGSNLFNLSILAFVDVVYHRGSLFAAVSRANSLVLLNGIVLAGLFLLVLRNPPRRRTLRLTWFGWAALGIYLFNALLLYLLR